MIVWNPALGSAVIDETMSSMYTGELVCASPTVLSLVSTGPMPGSVIATTGWPTELVGAMVTATPWCTGPRSGSNSMVTWAWPPCTSTPWTWPTTAPLTVTCWPTRRPTASVKSALSL